ncbi:hypothetical protein ABT354_11155 [Streptomyces sp. NPDC000594]|uniref:hypothetical protein n=1 Tax=Streptomyces sp. NPDC000594 TaxID=3154261 RepID=UPI00332E64FF
MKTQLAELRVGDYVKAEGVDTRGHPVSRMGTLLAEPKDVTAQRDGRRSKGWRLFVGLAGTDISERSTWVTIFPDAGSVEKAEPPEAGKWQNTQLREIPGVKATNHALRIHFGGKGGKRSTEPQEPVMLAGVQYTDDGVYEIYDVDTGAVLLAAKLQTYVWWMSAKPALQPAAAPLTVVPVTLPGEADDLGTPVSHTRTGAIVGYLREPRNGADWVFTPIGETEK